MTAEVGRVIERRRNLRGIVHAIESSVVRLTGSESPPRGKTIHFNGRAFGSLTDEATGKTTHFYEEPDPLNSMSRNGFMIEGKTLTGYAYHLNHPDSLSRRPIETSGAWQMVQRIPNMTPLED